MLARGDEVVALIRDTERGRGALGEMSSCTPGPMPSSAPPPPPRSSTRTRSCTCSASRSRSVGATRQSARSGIRECSGPDRCSPGSRRSRRTAARARSSRNPRPATTDLAATSRSTSPRPRRCRLPGRGDCRLGARGLPSPCRRAGRADPHRRGALPQGARSRRCFRRFELGVGGPSQAAASTSRGSTSTTSSARCCSASTTTRATGPVNLTAPARSPTPSSPRRWAAC